MQRQSRGASSRNAGNDADSGAPGGNRSGALSRATVMKWLVDEGMFGTAYVLDAETKVRRDEPDGDSAADSELKALHDGSDPQVPLRKAKHAAAALTDAHVASSKAGGRSQDLRMLAWEFGALLDGGGQLDHVLGELTQSSLLNPGRGAQKPVLPGRLYEMGLLDLDKLARGAPFGCQAQILNLTFALFACSFIELASPPQCKTHDAAALFRRLAPAFEASHGAMLSGLRSVVGLAPQSLIAWSGGGRSMDPVSGAAPDAMAAAAAAVVLPSVTGSASSSSSSAAGVSAEVRGVRTGSGHARSVAGPDFGQLPGRPHPVFSRWRDPARPCVVRMSPLARSLAITTMQRRGYAWLLRHLAPGTGTVRIVFTPTGTDSGSAGLGGAWAEHLALPVSDPEVVASPSADSDGKGADSDDSAPLLPQRGEAFGEGLPALRGAVPTSAAAQAPLSLAFLQPTETPQMTMQAARIAEATAGAKIAAGILTDGTSSSSSSSSSARAGAADAHALAESAAAAAASLGAGTAQAAAAGVSSLCRASFASMRSALDGEANLLQQVADTTEQQRRVIAESAGRLRRMVKDRAEEQVAQAVKSGGNKQEAETQASRQLGVASQGHYKQLTYADRAFWPNIRNSLAEHMEKVLSASVMPGGSVSVARAMLAHAGVGQRGPRPAGMLDASSPSPAHPPTAAFTVLGGAQASAVAVGVRRGCVAAGFADGGVLVWSHARRRWAEEHEAETHRAGVGASEQHDGGDDEEEQDEEDNGASGKTSGGRSAADRARARPAEAEEKEEEDLHGLVGRITSGGSDEDEDEDAEALLEDGDDDGDKRDEDDDDDVDVVAAMIAIDPTAVASSAASSASSGRAGKRGRAVEGSAEADAAASSSSSVQAAFDIDSAGAANPVDAMPRGGHHRPAVLLGHSAPVTCLALSPAEDWLLSGSVDGSVRLWSVPAAQCVAVYRHASGPVWDVSWCPGIPSLFASAAADGAARIWHTAETRRPARLLPTMSSSAEVVAWHPGCSYVLVGCSTGAVRLFDVETGSAVRLLIGHACPITAAVVSPCGKLAFTADAQGCVRGWDLEGGWCLGAQWAAGLGSGNRHAASAIGMARVTSLAVSPSSRVLAVSGIDSRIVLLDIKAWRASTDRLRALHSPQLRFRDSASSSAGLIAPVAGPSSSSSSSSSLSLSGRAAGSINHVPRSVITAEPEVEEAALAEAASDAAAQAARSAVLDTATEPGAGTGSKIRFHVLYGKSTRFGFMAFSRDGVLAVAGVFDPPRRTGL